MKPIYKPLVFSLKSEDGYLDATGYLDRDLAEIPSETIFLNLENANIGDEGILLLPNLRLLRCLDLDSTRITDKAMSKIGTFSAIEEIWIEDTKITDHGLDELAGLNRLQFISIMDCDISDAAVQRLRKAIPGVTIH